MTFKEFIALLFPFRESELAEDGIEEKPINKGAFISNLINNITEYEIPKFNGWKADTWRKEETLENNAHLIMDCGFDKGKFSAHIKKLVENSDVDDTALFATLEKHGIEVSMSDYADKLADIFIDIIERFARVKEEKRTKAKAKNATQNQNFNSHCNGESNQPNATDDDRMVELSGITITKAQAIKIKNFEETLKREEDSIKAKPAFDIKGSTVFNRIAYNNTVYSFFKSNPDLYGIFKDYNKTLYLQYAKICSDKGEKWTKPKLGR